VLRRDAGTGAARLDHGTDVSDTHELPAVSQRPDPLDRGQRVIALLAVDQRQRSVSALASQLGLQPLNLQLRRTKSTMHSHRVSTLMTARLRHHDAATSRA